MLVYGDRSETVDPRAYGRALMARCTFAAADRFDAARHAAVVEGLIDMGKLAQGLADAAFEAEGCDDGRYDQANVAACILAAGMAASWCADGPAPAMAPPNALGSLLEEDLPEAVTLKAPEGYAFYAVYPELYYLAAARRFEAAEGAPAIVGLRSIGSSLGAAAACGAVGFPPITLRPFGDPFDRKVAVADGLRACLNRRAKAGVIVVDEGPGASGSSFAAAGDLLESVGVPPDRITYMPSHGGEPGGQASERSLARWRSAKRSHVAFEDGVLPRLPRWAEPLIGALVEPLEDLSGGLWRRALGIEAPAWPEQERRKYLAVTGEGRFLLKFAGLGVVGRGKLQRARALHDAGFSPEPMGLAHGFLVERWMEDPPQTPGEADVEAVGRYLGFRPTCLDPPHGGADDAQLRAMMVRNFGLAGFAELAERARTTPAGERGPPCAIDGRLHSWEWRRTAEGRWIKLDSVDHCEAHDLIGAQDLAWDVAGAAIELGLGPEAAERLRRVAEEAGGRALDPRRVAFQTLAYLAFQIGWWTLASQGCEGRRAAERIPFYEDHARCWRAA